MKNIHILGLVACTIGLCAACKGIASHETAADFSHIREYRETGDDAYFKVDSLNGYSTFSADNNIIITPEEITQDQYKRLLTERYTVQAVEVDTNSPLYEELYNKGLQNAIRYDRERGLCEGEDEMLEAIRGGVKFHIPIYHYPETKQYEYVMFAPFTNESFMMTEDGTIDSTFMQSETKTYGTNGIFVGQEGHDCDYHGDLWFYLYDKQRHHMVPLCHYIDYRWHEDGVEAGFTLRWISHNELLVSAASTGNNRNYGWVGGYKPTNLAPHGTRVYYKLTIAIKQ